MYYMPGRENERKVLDILKLSEVYIHCACREEPKFLRSHCARCMPLSIFRKHFYLSKIYFNIVIFMATGNKLMDTIYSSVKPRSLVINVS